MSEQQTQSRESTEPKQTGDGERPAVSPEAGFNLLEWIRKFNLGSFAVAILLALFIRSFLFAAYKIPSGSMIPTLLVGDQLIVSKINMGLRLPFADGKLIEGRQPERGEVVIFRYPKDPSIDFIKRTIGIPGDTIRVEGTDLWVNGHKLPHFDAGTYTYITESGRQRTARRFQEELNGHRYYVLYDMERPFAAPPMEFRVPDGHFFMMGDNRDRSNDSRMWGFVPERYIEGTPLFIHFSWDGHEHALRWSRLGHTLP